MRGRFAVYSSIAGQESGIPPAIYTHHTTKGMGLLKSLLDFLDI
jgi:hypothetical protein